jgi:hypothetical protein
MQSGCPFGYPKLSLVRMKHESYTITKHCNSVRIVVPKALTAFSVKGKVHPFTETEALYKPYGPKGE